MVSLSILNSLVVVDIHTKNEKKTMTKLKRDNRKNIYCVACVSFPNIKMLERQLQAVTQQTVWWQNVKDNDSECFKGRETHNNSNL